MVWYKPICCLDQEYMYVFDHFCHCTQGLHKFMVTNVSIQGTSIKLIKECQAIVQNTFKSKISFPVGKLTTYF